MWYVGYHITKILVCGISVLKWNSFYPVLCVHSFIHPLIHSFIHFLVLGMEPRPLSIPDKHSVTELRSQFYPIIKSRNKPHRF
jgi:hypothetical protein